MNASEPLLSTAWGLGLCAFLEIILVALVFWRCATTALIRDTCADLPDFHQRPYSLAKSQLAFWTVVVIGCFIWIVFSTETYSNLMNNTALILLGISSGTAALSSAAASPSSAPPAPAPAAPPPPATQKHANFFDDILSDTQGMNIHRLQMVLWTAVFGGIFIYESAKRHQFPKFDDQAFVLMGISSATYVWFKRGEV